MGMNPKAKAAWLKLLRSDDFAQVKGQLCQPGKRANDKDKMCCLGVACEAAIQAKVIPGWEEDKKKFENAFLGEVTALGVEGRYGIALTILPEKVSEWLGLEYQDPYVIYDECEYSLSELNDTVGLSFKQIATIIEEQL